MNSSVIMLPVEHFPPFIILLHILYPPILRNHKPIPVSPIRILHLNISILIGIALLETNQLIEICQHIDEYTTLMLSFQEVIDSELDVVCGFEDVDHLADYVLEIKI